MMTTIFRYLFFFLLRFVDVVSADITTMEHCLRKVLKKIMQNSAENVVNIFAHILLFQFNRQCKQPRPWSIKIYSHSFKIFLRQ